MKDINMKRVTFTYTMEFADDVDDQTCIECLCETMGQDGEWNDNQFKIEKINKDGSMELVKGRKYRIAYKGPFVYNDFNGEATFTSEIDYNDPDGVLYGFSSPMWSHTCWFPRDSIFEI